MISLTNGNKCYKCDFVLTELDFSVKCDGFKLLIHNKCSNITTSKLKYRSIKYICESCNNCLSN